MFESIKAFFAGHKNSALDRIVPFSKNVTFNVDLHLRILAERLKRGYVKQEEYDNQVQACENLWTAHAETGLFRSVASILDAGEHK